MLLWYFLDMAAYPAIPKQYQSIILLFTGEPNQQTMIFFCYFTYFNCLIINDFGFAIISQLVMCRVVSRVTYFQCKKKDT